MCSVVVSRGKGLGKYGSVQILTFTVFALDDFAFTNYVMHFLYLAQLFKWAWRLISPSIQCAICHVLQPSYMQFMISILFEFGFCLLNMMNDIIYLASNTLSSSVLKI